MMDAAPPVAWLEVVLERPDGEIDLRYPTPGEAQPGDIPARVHVWREIANPRACDGALWLWLARSSARTAYGFCPVHVRLVRHQGEGRQTLLDVQL